MSTENKNIKTVSKQEIRDTKNKEINTPMK